VQQAIAVAYTYPLRRGASVELDVRLMRYFLAVVEEGSFTKAAHREHATQPGISMAISALEQRLSVKLLERHARGVAPTAAGNRLYAHCVRILKSVRAAEQQMIELRGAAVGRIHLGLPATLARGALPAVLSAFTSAFPHVDLRISQGYTSSLVELVKSGSLDFAIITRPDERLRNMQITSCHRDHVVLVSGKQWGLKAGKPVRLPDLSPLKLVLPLEHHPIRSMFNRLILNGEIPFARLLEMDGLAGVLRLIERTDWVTLLPSVALATGLGGLALFVSPIIEPEMEIEYFVIHPTTAPLPAITQQLLQMLKEQMAASVGMCTGGRSPRREGAGREGRTPRSHGA
jgi:LysR family transcriptional regulator, nitrogen assimilation regulatory protein